MFTLNEAVKVKHNIFNDILHFRWNSLIGCDCGTVDIKSGLEWNFTALCFSLNSVYVLSWDKCNSSKEGAKGHIALWNSSAIKEVYDSLDQLLSANGCTTSC